MKLLFVFKHQCLGPCNRWEQSVIWEQEVADESSVYALPDLRCMETNSQLLYVGRLGT